MNSDSIGTCNSCRYAFPLEECAVLTFCCVVLTFRHVVAERSGPKDFKCLRQLSDALAVVSFNLYVCLSVCACVRAGSRCCPDTGEFVVIFGDEVALLA